MEMSIVVEADPAHPSVKVKVAVIREPLMEPDRLADRPMFVARVPVTWDPDCVSWRTTSYVTPGSDVAV